MSDQEYKIRPAIVNINSHEPLFYAYSILGNKCSGSCNDINNPYSKLSVSEVVKDTKIKVFNLMLRTNKTCYVFWHENSVCKCGLDASAVMINNV